MGLRLHTETTCACCKPTLMLSSQSGWSLSDNKASSLLCFPHGGGQYLQYPGPPSCSRTESRWLLPGRKMGMGTFRCVCRAACLARGQCTQQLAGAVGLPATEHYAASRRSLFIPTALPSSHLGMLGILLPDFTGSWGVPTDGFTFSR